MCTAVRLFVDERSNIDYLGAYIEIQLIDLENTKWLELDIFITASKHSIPIVSAAASLWTVKVKAPI